MSAVEGALRHRVEHAKSRHHRARGQDFDLQVATGHVVDLMGVIESKLVEDILLWPGALPAHRDRSRLPLGNHREAEHRRSTGGHRCFQNVSA
jgi:hypothetical protein